MSGIALLLIALAVPQPDLLGDGQRAFARGDLDRAEALFREHVRRFPASAEGWSNLAAVQARRGQHAEAVPLYEKALKLDPKLVQVHFNLAVALGQLKRYPEAARHFRAFLKSYPNEARARQLLGLCLMESGDMRGALEELEKSYRLNPQDGSILYALASRPRPRRRRGESGRLSGENRIQPCPGEADQGLLLYRRGMWVEAKGAFREVVRLKPDFQPAVAALGRLELLERNDAAAIPLLERAVELNPHDAESAYQLGVLYDRNGDSEKGKKMLERHPPQGQLR